MHWKAGKARTACCTEKLLTAKNCKKLPTAKNCKLLNCGPNGAGAHSWDPRENTQSNWINRTTGASCDCISRLTWARTDHGGHDHTHSLLGEQLADHTEVCLRKLSFGAQLATARTALFLLKKRWPVLLINCRSKADSSRRMSLPQLHGAESTLMKPYGAGSTLLMILRRDLKKRPLVDQSNMHTNLKATQGQPTSPDGVIRSA